MKLVLFNDHQPGILRQDGVVDCSSLLAGRGPTTMTAVIEQWDDLRPQFEVLAAEGNALHLTDVELGAPTGMPGKIMCMAANFREGTGSALPINGFVVSPNAILGPGGTAVFPPQDFKVCHHEAELVCVIGKAARNINRSDAMNHVFGYTAGVDVSARASDSVDWGFLGKACDGFKPIGPCIVTADDIPDPHALQVQLSVDGHLRQDYNTSDIGHPISECIEWFSSIMTLLPGDLLFMGTNHQQVGPLQDGERVDMSIEGIGSFSFWLSDPRKRSWPKGVDLEVGETVRQWLEAGRVTRH
jgi:2-keto-4-pentenoate hydratase/2-oxohepta-3-ene-1,7-dioic acid hydratase in catechol pathway